METQKRGMALPEKPVFRGDIKTRVVSDGVLAQAKRTQVMTFVADRTLITALFVLNDDDDNAVMTLGGAPRLMKGKVVMTDPIGAFRTFRLLEALERVDDDSVIAALTVPIAALAKAEGAEVPDAMPALKSALGAAMIDEIMAAVPKDLAALMRHLRDDEGVVLVTTAVTDEIERGHVEMNAELAALGVEHPRARRERLDRRKQFDSRLRPHFENFAKARGLPETAGSMIDEFIRAAQLAQAKKLTDETPLLVGLGFVAGMLLPYRDAPSLIKSLTASISSAVAGSASFESVVFMVASSMVAKEFPDAGDPATVAHKLLDLWGKWDSIPVDVEML